MNSTKLSKRLQVVADYVSKGARLADIGSDHAYLPCYLAEQNVIDFAVAGEVVIGPFNNALQEVKYKNFHTKIDVRLGDGLSVVTKEDKIDTITICGMGGALIRSILENGLHKDSITSRETLILQPNVFEETVREYLMEQSYEIIEEAIVEENDKIYEIIKAVPAKEKIIYTRNDLLFGPNLRNKKSELFKKKWRKESEKYAYIIEQMEKASLTDNEKVVRHKETLDLIKEMLK